MRPRLLVIDDDGAFRASVRAIFEREGYECLLAGDAQAGLKTAADESPDLIFLDIKMQGADGIDLLRRLRAERDAPPVVMVSGHGTVSTAVEAARLGAFDFIEKPAEAERLLLVARNAISQKRLTDENLRLRLSADVRHRLVGESRWLQELRDIIFRAAPLNATVLVTGESGCGKELVMRALHRNSPRKDQAFVQVNCAAIPEELIESELFGHEKGSFTGATQRQIGKFELADGGTLVLDEVGDMSLRTQAKVLRALQEREIERIGSRRSIPVDVRVIAATNKDLQSAMARGEFREDLYFRLSVIPIRVPPLRERTEDIPVLVEYYVRQLSREYNLRPKTLAPPAMDLLMRHSWPGNVRELRNTVERLLIMGPRDVVAAEDLAAILPQARAAAADEPPSSPAMDGPPRSLRAAVDAYERELILDALRRAGGNQSKAARLLETTERSIRYKMKSHKIDRTGL
jgi:two-component system nitrogen regulation response regulator NtrX